MAGRNRDQDNIRSTTPMRLLLFGAPGVGKGTQAKLLADEFRIPHISTGDLLRTAVANGTELGKKAKVIMDVGKLVPDDVMIGLVRGVLGSPLASTGFILDGFPRTLNQARALTQMFEELRIRDYRVLNIEVSNEEIIRRLSTETDGVAAGSPCPDCGGELYQRDDDQPETVRHRLEVYSIQTSPILKFYKDLGVELTVNGMDTVENVHRNITRLLQSAELR
jgi:adenylate kinase